MPQTAEQRRESQREYYQLNREKILERRREYRAQNLERIREYDRQRGHQERRLAANREYYARNRDRLQSRDRRRQRRDHHGLWPEDWTNLWNAQDHRCYLCGDETALEETCIDHDHDCCRRNYSCHMCRRGLACHKCNTAIGLANDDPDRLRRMADALEAAQVAFRQRKEEAAAGEQLALSG